MARKRKGKIIVRNGRVIKQRAEVFQFEQEKIRRRKKHLLKIWIEERLDADYVRHEKFVIGEPDEFRFWKHEVQLETRYYIIPDGYYVNEGEIYNADNNMQCRIVAKTPPPDRRHSCFRPKIIDGTLGDHEKYGGYGGRKKYGKLPMREFNPKTFREIRRAYLLETYGDERYHTD